MTITSKLQLARNCFIDLIETADEWDISTDLDVNDRPQTTYRIGCREFELRQLVEALGIPIRDDESAGDAIERALKE